MRWHCRLSHVAAHTSMLSVFLDDLLSRSPAEIEKILTFVGSKVGRSELLIASNYDKFAALRAELNLKGKSVDQFFQNLNIQLNFVFVFC